MADKIVLYDENLNKHYPAPDTFMPDVLSKEDGNYLRLGNDKGIFVDGNDILSNQADNALGISVVDGKIYYKGAGGGTGDSNVDSVSVNNQAPVLPDVNNNVGLTGIVTGIKFDSGAVTFTPNASGVLELPDYPAEIDIDISDYVSTDDCNLISVTTDGKLETLASTLVSADANNIIAVGDDCKLFVPPPAAVVIPEATTTMFGIVKYDGTTITKNVSGQLTASVTVVPELANSSSNFSTSLQFELTDADTQTTTLWLDEAKRYEIFLTGTTVPTFAAVTIGLDSTNIPDIDDTETFYEIELSVINEVAEGVILTLGDTQIADMPLAVGNQFNIVLRKYRNIDTDVLDIWRIHEYSSSIYDSSTSGITPYPVIDPYGWLRARRNDINFSQVIQGFEGYEFTSIAVAGVGGGGSGVINLVRGVHRRPCSFKLRLNNRRSTTSTNWTVDIGIVGVNGASAPHTLFSATITYYTVDEYTINCDLDPSGNEVWTWYKNERVTNTSLPDATTFQAGVVRYDGVTITKNATGQLIANVESAVEPDGTTIAFNTDNQLALVQYNQLQDFGTSSSITLDLTTRTSTVVTSASNLTVNIAKLANTVDKLTTLVIKASAAINVTWSFTGGAIWTTEAIIEKIAIDEIAVVNIWQLAGGCLLSTIYTGPYNS